MHRLRQLLGVYATIFLHWPPLVLVLLATLLAQTAYSMITPTLPLFLSGALRTPVFAIGLVFAAYAVTETLFKAPGGAFGDRWGRGPVAIAGLLVGIISPLVMTVAGRWQFFVPLRALDGLGVALVWPTVMALIGEKVPARDKALAMSAFNLPYLGGLVLGMSGGLQIGHYTGDNRYVFWGSSLLLLLAAVCVAVMSLWDRRRGGAARETPAPPDPDRDPRPGLLSPGWWERLRDLHRRRATLLHMLWMFALIQMAASLLVPVMTLYARDSLHLSQAGMVKMFVVPGLVAAFMAMPLGRLADRLGRVWVVRLGLLLGAVGLASIPGASRQQWVVVGLMTLLGLSYVALMPAWMALTSELAPAHRQGLALGAMNTAQGLGFVVASVLGAALYQWRPAAPFFGGALLLGVCLVLSLFLLRVPSRSAASPAGGRGQAERG